MREPRKVRLLGIVYPPMRRCFVHAVGDVGEVGAVGEVGEAQLGEVGEAGGVGAAGGNPPTQR